MTASFKGMAYLLVAMIPMFILGYFLSVGYEEMFFIYEWLLGTVVLSVFVLSIKSIWEIKDERKWIAGSFFAFILQFFVLSLFLGPFTYYSIIFVYYGVALCAFLVFVIALRRNKTLRVIPSTFMVITGAFTLYVILLNNLWGTSLM